MKLDLHLHSVFSVKNGDAINWPSDIFVLKKLHSKRIQAFSFTDHNTFDANQYFKMNKTKMPNSFLFPGLEADVLKEDGTVAHLLIIFDWSMTDEQIKQIEEICNCHLRKGGVRIEKVLDAFKDFKTIMIPHVGKADYFRPNELTFDHDAVEITSSTHHNYKKWLKENNNKSTVAFSDTHSWKDYPQNSKLITEIEFDGTFEGLKKELNKGKNYTKEV